MVRESAGHAIVPPAVAVAKAAPVPGFVRPEFPEVSVVIPMFNHVDMTLGCLRSLAAAGSQRGFEVIVVDDASTDEAIELVRKWPGIVYCRNETNLGFVDSSNAGAAVARGRSLVFLNNDTLVTAGWLDRMLDTLDEPGVGLVGACLQYPDGILQEAGGIVFSDASGWNYGRGGNPADPRFCYRRETDYCSGAALAIPRTLFERLNGFASHYAPAYYEDTDLAMAVRACGSRVIYEPGAVVVHLEGVSAGTDTSSGMKAFQVSNRARFQERWKGELQHFHAAPGIDPDIVVRRAGRHLIVAAYDPGTGGNDFLGLVESLAGAGCAIDLHVLADMAEQDQRRLRHAGICVWPPSWLATGRWVLMKSADAIDAVLSDGSVRVEAWSESALGEAASARFLRFGAGHPVRRASGGADEVSTSDQLLTLLEERYGGRVTPGPQSPVSRPDASRAD